MLFATVNSVEVTESNHNTSLFVSAYLNVTFSKVSPVFSKNLISSPGSNVLIDPLSKNRIDNLLASPQDTYAVIDVKAKVNVLASGTLVTFQYPFASVAPVTFAILIKSFTASP